MYPPLRAQVTSTAFFHWIEFDRNFFHPILFTNSKYYKALQPTKYLVQPYFKARNSTLFSSCQFDNFYPVLSELKKTFSVDCLLPNRYQYLLCLTLRWLDEIGWRLRNRKIHRLYWYKGQCWLSIPPGEPSIRPRVRFHSETILLNCLDF